MRRMLSLLIILSIFYILMQFVFVFIEKGHVIEYSVSTNENNFDIKEIYTVNDKNEDDNYYFEISINGTTFDYQTFKNYNMISKIIKNIYYFKGEYECILPVFYNNEILTDIICKKENNYYLYNNIKGNSELDQFATTLKEYGYNNELFNDNLEEFKKSGNLTAFNNSLDKHYLALEGYKGLYTLNSRFYENKIFENDVYTKNISGYTSKYYIVADYTKNTKFNVFNIIDITNNKKTTISYDYDISLDSYILGEYDNSIYIMDKSNMKEYELDMDTKTIIEVGNKNIGIKMFKNNQFEYENAYNVVQNNLTFESYDSNIFDNSTYARVIKTGIEKSGYYYIFEQNNGYYKVYRSNIQNGVNKTYLFNTTSLRNFIHYKDYVYFQDGSYIKRYSDTTGIKTIFKYDELKFNNNIKLGLYVK